MKLICFAVLNFTSQSNWNSIPQLSGTNTWTITGIITAAGLWNMSSSCWQTCQLKHHFLAWWSEIQIFSNDWKKKSQNVTAIIRINSHSCVAQGNRIMWDKHPLQSIWVFLSETTNQKCLPLASRTAKIATGQLNVFFNSDVRLKWISSLISHSSEMAAFSLVSATFHWPTAPLLGAFNPFINSNDSKIPVFPWIPNMVSVHLFFF